MTEHHRQVGLLVADEALGLLRRGDGAHNREIFRMRQSLNGLLS